VAPLPRRLVLFDIDGTLVTTGGRAGRAIARSLETIFGVPVALDSYSFTGKTDPHIVVELLGRAGVPRSAVEARLDEALTLYLALLTDVLTPGAVRVLPGVTSLLERLATRADVAMGLLTGNLAGGADIKLGAAGLRHFFPIGAFGSDHEDRDRLVDVARTRAREHFRVDFPGHCTIVVGDAEADVRCARAGDARAVVVASGWTSREALAALTPDAILDSLADPDALDTILGSARECETVQG
jgi:phosphoglycolate phosphatase